MLLLLAALAQGPALDVRVAGAWQAWPDYPPGGEAAAAPALARALAWRDSAPGLRGGAFEVRVADGDLRNSIAVIELDPAVVGFALGRRAPAERRTAEQWLRADSTLLLTANTGLFREDGTSQGLVAADGIRTGAPVAWLDAAVVITDGVLRLTDRAGAAAAPSDAEVFQTLPWLVRDGRVAFGATSGGRLSRTHRDRRLTLCVGTDGRVRLLLSNYEAFGAELGRIPIGLTIAEQAAIAAGLGCRDAVALDGGISAQVAMRAGGRVVSMPGWRRVPLMLLVRRR